MTYSSDSDEPSPIHDQRTFAQILFHYRKTMIISTGVLMGCFLLLPFVQAQPSNSVRGQGRDSVRLTEALCAIDTHVPWKSTMLSDGRRMMQAFCNKSSQSVQEVQRVARLRAYLKGYPMVQMVDALAQQDPIIMAYLVAMAKQESNWGKRVPVLNGRDCFNYWGFRAKRPRMGTGGHTCFDSPEDAVATVARRVRELVYDYGRTTPRKMLVWKCGRSCATHDPAGVERWVSVIGRYYRQVLAITQQPAT